MAKQNESANVAVANVAPQGKGKRKGPKTLRQILPFLTEFRESNNRTATWKEIQDHFTGLFPTVRTRNPRTGSDAAGTYKKGDPLPAEIVNAGLVARNWFYSLQNRPKNTEAQRGVYSAIVAKVDDASGMTGQAGPAFDIEAEMDEFGGVDAI